MGVDGASLEMPDDAGGVGHASAPGVLLVSRFEGSLDGCLGKPAPVVVEIERVVSGQITVGRCNASAFKHQSQHPAFAV